MCRNITTLRGLEPAATPVKIEAAARQYVRKVSGITRPSTATDDAVAEAVEEAIRSIAAATDRLLGRLPPRRRPPPTLPPLRRLSDSSG